MKRRNAKAPRFAPRLFVGSSSEALRCAKRASTYLKSVAAVRLWTEIFDLGKATIESLFEELRRADYAVLIATADDRTWIRGQEFETPRDNVVFEAGLFMGRLGRNRAFVICDRRLKLPSDLKGVTVAQFHPADDRSLQRATAKIAKIISESGTQRDVDFLRAYLDLIDPQEIGLRDPVGDILVRHHASIVAELEVLRLNRDWPRLIKVKEQLREYFVYSGTYLDGIKFGVAHAHALKKLGMPYEAAWASVKDVGYLRILAGRHTEGRRAIQGVLQQQRTWKKGKSNSACVRLLFYAHRYLAISYHRAPVISNMRRAHRELALAAKCLENLPKNSHVRRELNPRLLRNQAHLVIAQGIPRDALKLYRGALRGFERIDDIEHVGITKLAIGQALLRFPSASREDPLTYLLDAERAFVSIGWLEGQLRVCLELGPYFVRSARETIELSPDLARCMIIQAEACSEKSSILHERLQTRRFGSRSNELDREIRILKEELQRHANG